MDGEVRERADASQCEYIALRNFFSDLSHPVKVLFTLLDSSGQAGLASARILDAL